MRLPNGIQTDHGCARAFAKLARQSTFAAAGATQNDDSHHVCWLPQDSVGATGRGFLHGLVGFRRDLVPQISKFFVEKVLHPLMKYLDRRTHRANHASADDSLCQLEMMKAEQ